MNKLPSPMLHHVQVQCTVSLQAAHAHFTASSLTTFLNAMLLLLIAWRKYNEQTTMHMHPCYTMYKYNVQYISHRILYT
jgi:hypothetical protein